MRRALLAALLLLVCAPSALATGGADRVPNCSSSQVRPATILLACVNAYTYIDKIGWQSFGGASASGAGRYVANSCGCANGHYHSYPITFTLSRAKRCPDNHDDYRQLDMLFTAGRPPSTPTHFSEQLLCPTS